MKPLFDGAFLRTSSFAHVSGAASLRPSRRVSLRVSAVAAVCAAVAAPAWAEADLQIALAPTLNDVVVTATRTAQPVVESLADVSVVDSETIERMGAASLADVLQQLPGVEWTRNGGPTATTSVLLRGADSRHTLLMIDGVRVDSQSTGGAAWQALALSQIDRIEVVRGPAAAIYGSDAVGGVVQVFTRQGEGPARPTVAVGIGSYGTRTADLGISGSQGAWDYALAVGREISSGFNIQPAGNPDKDGYQRTSSTGRVGLKVNADHKVQLQWLTSEANTGYDAYASKSNDRSLQDIFTLGLSWDAKWSDTWRSKLAVTRGKDRYETTPSVYVTDTVVNTVLFQNEWKLGPGLLVGALERREDNLTNASTTPKNTQRSQNALALGYSATYGVHAVQVNVRRDDDSEFGAHTTGNIGYGLNLSPQWRLTAAAGTAFRAPTLYQRFSIYGIPTLKAEEGKNLELGVRYTGQGYTASAVAYRNRVTNLINYVSGPGTCVNGVGTYAGCYGNTGRATLSGVTLASGAKVGSVDLTASLDLQNPRNDQTGKLLARRAKQTLKLGADTTVAGWKLGSEVQLRGQRYDDAANLNRLPGYGVLNLSATKSLGSGLSLVMRVDNLGDKDYQTARGYATGGRTAYLGLKWSAL